MKMNQQFSTHNTSNLFYSHDLGLVAYLLCLDKYELVGLDKAVRSKVLFILNRDPHIGQDIKKFWEFRTSIDAQTYFNQIKRLKNQIYSSD